MKKFIFCISILFLAVNLFAYTGDGLGDHKAKKNLNMNGKQITNPLDIILGASNVFNIYDVSGNLLYSITDSSMTIVKKMFILGNGGLTVADQINSRTLNNSTTFYNGGAANIYGTLAAYGGFYLSGNINVAGATYWYNSGSSLMLSEDGVKTNLGSRTDTPIWLAPLGTGDVIFKGDADSDMFWSNASGSVISSYTAASGNYVTPGTVVASTGSFTVLASSTSTGAGTVLGFGTNAPTGSTTPDTWIFITDVVTGIRYCVLGFIANK